MALNFEMVYPDLVVVTGYKFCRRKKAISEADHFIFGAANPVVKDDVSAGVNMVAAPGRSASGIIWQIKLLGELDINS